MILNFCFFFFFISFSREEETPFLVFSHLPNQGRHQLRASIRKKNGTQVKAVSVSNAFIKNNSPSIHLNFEELRSTLNTKVVKNTGMHQILGRTVWLGMTKTGHRVAFVTGRDEKVHGTAIVKNKNGERRQFEVLTNKNNQTLLVEVTPEKESKIHPTIFRSKVQKRNKRDVNMLRHFKSITRRDASDEGTVINVMILYLNSTVKNNGRDYIESKIIAAVADGNQAFSNSHIPVSLNLVYTGMISYDESNDDMSTTLIHLQSENDGMMDVVHKMRDAYEADIVQLVTSQNNYCGLGFTLDKSSVGNKNFAPFAFSVVSSFCLSIYSSLHEMGHNMGLLHNRESSSASSNDVDTNAFGYHDCTPGNTFRTIMSYSCPNDATVRIPYFSNPSQKFGNSPLGADPTLNPEKGTNNTAVLLKTILTAANWRGSSVSIPNTPDSLTGDASKLNNILLKWNPVTSITGYKLMKSINKNEFFLLATLSSTASSYNDNSVIENTKYDYKIAAFNNAGASSFSNVISLTSKSQFNAVKGISVSSSSSGQSVIISWTTFEKTIKYLSIFRNTSTTPWNLIVKNILPNSLKYEDQKIQPTTQYFYFIRALDSSNKVTDSIIFSVKTKPISRPTNDISSPTNVVINFSKGAVNINWKVPNGALNVVISKSTTLNGPYSTLSSLPGTATSFIDKTSGNGILYYKICATSYTIWVCSLPVSITTPPSPPTLKTLSRINTKNQLSWLESSSASGYKIFRSCGSTNYLMIQNFPSQQRQFSEDVTENSCSYKVRAYNSAGESLDSNVLTTPLPPLKLTAVKSGKKTILSWNPIIESMGYEVLKASPSGFVKIKSLGDKVSTFTDDTLSSNKPSTYIVQVLMKDKTIKKYNQVTI